MLVVPVSFALVETGDSRAPKPEAEPHDRAETRIFFRHFTARAGEEHAERCFVENGTDKNVDALEANVPLPASLAIGWTRMNVWPWAAATQSLAPAFGSAESGCSCWIDVLPFKLAVATCVHRVAFSIGVPAAGVVPGWRLEPGESPMRGRDHPVLRPTR